MPSVSSGLEAIPFLTAEDVRDQVDEDRARQLIEDALVRGFDPGQDPVRSNVPLSHGHLLLMPSEVGDVVGVKVASVTPENPRQGLPRIQAMYLLMDAATLTPRLLLEGSELTLLRTPATSAVAADRLAPQEAENLVVFGNGPQAIEHVMAMRRIRSVQNVRVVGRNEGRAQLAIEELAKRGVSASIGKPEDVAEADLVVCATSSSEPLFDGSLVRDGACVVAMGSHEATYRELEGSLVGRSLVVVEDERTALRESGDIIMALREGAADASQLRSLRALVAGAVQPAKDRPNVFKGSGMSWQDLAVVAGLCGPVS